MRRFLSMLTALMILGSMLLVMMPLEASAADAFDITGTVGTYLEFVLFDSRDEAVTSTKCTGSIPGLSIEVKGEGKAVLAGTPTTAGTYVVEITIGIDSAYEYNIVMTVTISEPAPVVTKDPTGETVVEGESATFIAKANNVRQYIWEIGIADASLEVQDLPDYIGKGIKVSGWNTEKLVIENIPLELNGAYIWCRFVGADGSVTSEAAVLKVIAEKDAVPVVTKHPTAETVEEGGTAVFISKAKYVQIYNWQMISPSGVIYDLETANLTFPDLKITGAKTERLTLSNIPLELNGYMIRCMFTAGDAVTSNSAKLTVTEKATEPTEEPTEGPTEEPTEEPTETGTEPGSDVNTEPSDAPETDPSKEADKTGTGEQNGPAIGTNKEFRGGDKDEDDGGDNTLIIVLIVSIAAVAVAAIVGVTILKLKKL